MLSYALICAFRATCMDSVITPKRRKRKTAKPNVFAITPQVVVTPIVPVLDDYPGSETESDTPVSDPPKITKLLLLDGNDDICALCRKKGKLLCCENCTRAYHGKCLISINRVKNTKLVRSFKSLSHFECDMADVACGPSVD